MTIKSHEEHQALIDKCVTDIHTELDCVLSLVVEDRSYGHQVARGQQKTEGWTGDVAHVKKLFDRLCVTITQLQTEDASGDGKGRRKTSKALGTCPHGRITVSSVAPLALRILRVHPMTTPKQARVEKRVFDELMLQGPLEELHCLGWRLVALLFSELQFGTEGVEVELAELLVNELKYSLKRGVFSRASVLALDEVRRLVGESHSLNGQLLVQQLLRSGVLGEVAAVTSRDLIATLRAGIAGDAADSLPVRANKRIRHQQVTESDRERAEQREAAFAARLQERFALFMRSVAALETTLAVVPVEEHVAMAESLLAVLCALLQTGHNYHPFLTETLEEEYLPAVYAALSQATITFQPAHLPPFLPLALRLFARGAARGDKCGDVCRRALLQADLLIHPRRAGPTINGGFMQPPAPVVSNAVAEVEMEGTEEDEEIVVDREPTVIPVLSQTRTVADGLTTAPQSVAASRSGIAFAQPTAPTAFAQPTAPTAPVQPTAPAAFVQPTAPVQPTTPTHPTQITHEADDDDEPLPSIIDCEPDE